MAVMTRVARYVHGAADLRLNVPDNLNRCSHRERLLFTTTGYVVEIGELLKYA